jgi:creatinine amidohydrolase
MALFLEEIGWPDVAEYLQKDDRLILVVGSTEQHGRHMTFASDVWVPWEIGVRLSTRTGVLLAPPLNYGMSLHHLGFPGSLSLRPGTLSSIVVDLLESAYGHGFRHILILNGHGGNIASIQVALAEALHELHSLDARLVNWWHLPAVEAIFEDAFPGESGSHADPGETSMILALRPDVVRLDRAEFSPELPEYGFLTRQVFLEHFPHGVIGADPHRASAEVGERVLAAAVNAYETLLRSWQGNS